MLLKLNEFLLESPLHQWLGCILTEVDIDSGRVKILLPFRRELLGAAGADSAHGGVVAAFVDVAAHACLHVRTRIGMPTIDLRVDFLRPATLPLSATAVARRAGRTIGVADVEVFDQAGGLCALGRATYLTRDSGASLADVQSVVDVDGSAG
jgi:uncharacterized protein (TIGR00369 family)